MLLAFMSLGLELRLLIVGSARINNVTIARLAYVSRFDHQQSPQNLMAVPNELFKRKPWRNSMLQISSSTRCDPKPSITAPALKARIHGFSCAQMKNAS